jgi:hypothetical protein
MHFNDLMNEVKPAAVASLGKKNVPHFSKEIGFDLIGPYDQEYGIPRSQNSSDDIE